MRNVSQTKSAGGIVINQDNQILLVQEFGEYWGLPRGHIEENEDVLATAEREIKEETGITKLTKIADLGSYTRSTFDSNGLPNYKEIKHITHFAFTTTQIEINPKDGDITDIGWFNPKEAEAMFINKEDLEFFKGAMNKVRGLLHKF